MLRVLQRKRARNVVQHPTAMTLIFLDMEVPVSHSPVAQTEPRRAHAICRECRGDGDFGVEQAADITEEEAFSLREQEAVIDRREYLPRHDFEVMLRRRAHPKLGQHRFEVGRVLALIRPQPYSSRRRRVNIACTPLLTPPSVRES